MIFRKYLPYLLLIAPVYQITLNQWISSLEWKRLFIQKQLNSNKELEKGFLFDIDDPKEKEVIRNRLASQLTVYYKGKDITTSAASLESLKLNERVEKAKRFSLYHRLFHVE